MSIVKNIYLIVFMLAGLMLAGCKKFLEQEPYNRLSVNDIFRDLEGARTTLVGCYDNFKDANYHQRMFSLYPELTGGNIKYARSNDPYLFNAYYFANTTLASQNDMTSFYQLGYNTIYRANNVLQYIDQVTDATTLQRNRLLAEAYSFRALAHFDLVRVFALPYNYTADASHEGIVIRTANTNPEVPVEAPASVRAVYQQIGKDLDSAIVLYTNSTNIYAGGDAKSWLNIDAARGFRMRVALYMEDWTKAIEMASLVIGTNSYSLVSNSSYASSWRRSTSPNMDQEALFYLFALTDINQGSYGDNFNAINNSIFGYMAASNDLLNLYAPNDVRGKATMYRDTTMSNVRYSFTRKYLGRNDSANNQKLIRISEVWLSRAEAYAEGNNLAAALSDLNRIRQRAIAGLPAMNTTDRQAILDSIYVERRRELCFEEHGLWDITRKKKSLVRTDCTGATCSIGYPSTLFACTKPTQR
jgi:hypothetical protein